jgi:hypothetical protein
MLIFSSLGGALTLVANGKSKVENIWRKRLAITHGIGLTLVLVSGFGMLARLGIHSIPSWAILKLIIWIALGGLLTLIYRQAALASKLWWTLLAFGFFAALLGKFHNQLM